MDPRLRGDDRVDKKLKNMKKLLSIIAILIFTAFLGHSFFVNAETNSACSDETLSDTFLKTINKNKEIFFATDISKNPSKKYPKLKTYIEGKKEYIRGKEGEEGLQANALEKYHTLQEQVFESAINQSLQKFGEKDATLTWLINDEKSHPILSLYKNRFEGNEKENGKVEKLAQHIPTFVVGLEATLNYAIFSCVYNFSSSEIIGSSNSFFTIFKKEKITRKEFAENLLDAKRILDYTLQSYDSLIIAYPQHQAYEKLIDELKILKKQFATFEAINSQCVYPNHFNASCKK